MRRRIAATVVTLSLLLFAVPVLAATTLTDEGGNVVGVTSDEAYAYLFRLSEDATMLASNTTPTDFTTGSSDVCAAYGDDDYRVVAVDDYTVCNSGVRTACEAETGASTADFSCVAGVLDIGGGGGDVCGDEAVTGAEACDDGNTDAGDGCSAVCAVEDGWTCNEAEPSVCSELPIWTLNDPVDGSDVAAMVGLGIAPLIFLAAAYWPRKG